MDKERITSEKEKETLLIPLYCKYLESKKENPIIIDKKAIEIVDHIEYNYTQLNIPKQTYITICLR
jgi:O-methyltransferase involved in polyketide biosynthesis